MCLLLLYAIRRHHNARRASLSHGTTGNVAKGRCGRRPRSLLRSASAVGVAVISLSLPTYFFSQGWDREVMQYPETVSHRAEMSSSNLALSHLVTPPSLEYAQNRSSVDYMACCGAGHRLSKMADAYYLAKQLQFSLRAYWGYCDTSDRNGHLTEVFHYLFGPQTMPNINHHNASTAVESIHHHYARINNDVPGFHKLMRNGSHCHVCHAEKAHSDAEFYRDLRDRFQDRRSTVRDFYQTQLRKNTNTIIIGMHIRAGNGESGDFSQRGRNIENISIWLENLTDLLLQACREHNWRDAVLFLATDTPNLVDQVSTLLQQKKHGDETAIDVVQREQIRPIEGSGVLFGQHGNVESTGDDCLQGWEDTMVDMILLSHADVVISARPSSFTQSLPMSLVLSRNTSTRRVDQPYCEVNTDASIMQCFSNFSDWCCGGRTEFSLEGIQRYDYLRMPGNLFSADLNSDDLTLQKKLKVQRRPEQGCIPVPAGSKQICLPHDWSEFAIKPRPDLRVATR